MSNTEMIGWAVVSLEPGQDKYTLRVRQDNAVMDRIEAENRAHGKLKKRNGTVRVVELHARPPVSKP